MSLEVFPSSIMLWVTHKSNKQQQLLAHQDNFYGRVHNDGKETVFRLQEQEVWEV